MKIGRILRYTLQAKYIKHVFTLGVNEHRVFDTCIKLFVGYT